MVITPLLNSKAGELAEMGWESVDMIYKNYHY
jgi:hypothetical protein